ncbi:uncharacterized protein GGS25DRAFT_530667 [Hypoxylon fragiforme]|uniref:uncharacterized protein n=1 Tax=Hypoxylon fragiforme TaxID=63214 RepID=UPI0020C5F50B|nr:uncharacterized protein GGS25DRAFT_530667 [Hypoxylon fragiforme]KAI2609569.1 hypothetical protein GGS25DRAFT_530667 [Hypoxylon fragiforme]
MPCIISIKALIRKLRRATIIVRVETKVKREREVIDLTTPYASPTPQTKPATAPVPARVKSDRRSERELSRTMSASSREATPGPNSPGSPATTRKEKGKEPCRPPYPADMPKTRPEASTARSSRETMTAEASSTSSSARSANATRQQQEQRSAAPERSLSATAAAEPDPSSRKRSLSITATAEPAPSSRKRSSDTQHTIEIKDEPEDDDDDDNYDYPNNHRHLHNSLPHPPKKEEDPDSDDNDDDDDEPEISPFKRQRTSTYTDLSAIPLAPLSSSAQAQTRARSPSLSPSIKLSPSPSPSRSPSPSPSAPTTHIPVPSTFPSPFVHPSFPSRPPLRCPQRNRSHTTISTAQSSSARNHDRVYFRCGECAAGFGNFICWADALRVRADNPRCDCGHPAREDITGDAATVSDVLFYKCATNACAFRRFEWDDPLSAEEVNRFCGRRVYML